MSQCWVGGCTSAVHGAFLRRDFAMKQGQLRAGTEQHEGGLMPMVSHQEKGGVLGAPSSRLTWGRRCTGHQGILPCQATSL